MTDSFDTKDGRTQYLDEQGNLVGKIDHELHKENELRDNLEDINDYLLHILADTYLCNEHDEVELVLSAYELKLLQLYFEKQLIRVGMQCSALKRIGNNKNKKEDK